MKFEVLEKFDEILKHLNLGINIPIQPRFFRYIVETFKIFNAKAILLKDDIQQDVIGISVIFGEEETLFFGFFGVKNDEETRIVSLINYLLKFASDNKYKFVRGPINIPAIIYGYGFSTEKKGDKLCIEEPELFIACPMCSLTYLKIFHEKGFYKKFEEDHMYVPMFKLNPSKFKYDYSDYEVLFPGKEKVWKFKEDALKLHVENMPEESLLTPHSPLYANLIIDFIFEFGKSWMIWFVRHIPTMQIISTIHIVPNLFGKKDYKGRYEAASLQHVAIDKSHQGKGIIFLIYAAANIKAKDRKSGNNIKYGIAPVASSNEHSKAWMKKLGGRLFKRNIILEYRL